MVSESRGRHLRRLRSAGRLAVFIFLCAAMRAQSNGTFTNPLLPSGPDPWVTYKDGYYYYTNSTQTNLTLWKTRSVVDLKNATKKVVWTPPASGPYSHDIWAPEIHFLSGKWYIYFAADAGTNQTHRLWVVENSSPDPLEGEWTFKGQVTDASNKWAIDGSVFEDQDKLYLIWSGWEGDMNGTQNIYIARMKNPWTVESARLRVSTPEYPWEKVGDVDQKKTPWDPPHIDVNEGPEILQHDDKIFLIYSASACWTDYYELGMVTATSGTDLLNPVSWKKSSEPVFKAAPENGVYATGHNSFFQSLDGKQSWILYHANPESGQGCGLHRSPRAQPFTWKSDGTPDFGKPLPTGTPLPRPSGDPSN
jgi:GH43 family beta-xylosidase